MVGDNGAALRRPAREWNVLPVAAARRLELCHQPADQAASLLEGREIWSEGELHAAGPGDLGQARAHAHAHARPAQTRHGVTSGSMLRLAF